MKQYVHYYKHIIFFAALMIFLLGAGVHVKGMETENERKSIDISFEDGMNGGNFSTPRILNIKIDPEQIAKEQVENRIEGTSVVSIEWESDQAGKIVFKEEGVYCGTIVAGEEEFQLDKFCIDLHDPKKPEINPGDYVQGKWTKQDVVLKPERSSAYSGIDRYEYKMKDGAWKEVSKGRVIIHENMDQMIFFRCISKAGRQSQAAGFWVRYWNEKPGAPVVKVRGNQKDGWYQKSPNISVKTKKENGPEVQVYCQVEHQEIGSVKILKNKLPALKGEGTYQLTFWTKDQAGNRSSTIRKKQICIDRTRPEIELYDFTQGKLLQGIGTKERIVVVNVRESFPDFSKMKIDTSGTVEGEWRQTEEGWQVKVVFAREGRHDLHVYAEDLAGNQKEKYMGPFTIDRTKPVIQINERNKSQANDHKVRLKIQIKDPNLDEASCRVLLNGKVMKTKMTKYRDEIILAVPAVKKDGHYLFSVQAGDLAGNVEKKTKIFTINKTGTRIRLDPAFLNGAVTNRKNIFPGFFIDNIDPVIVTKFTVNGRNAAYIMKDSTVRMRMPITVDGTYRIDFQVQDLSGNRDGLKKPVEFVYDSTPPVIFFKKTGRGKLLIYTQKQEDYITKVICDGVEKKIHKNQYVFSVKKAGRYCYQAVAQDNAGNRSEKEIRFVIKKKGGKAVCSILPPKNKKIQPKLKAVVPEEKQPAKKRKEKERTFPYLIVGCIGAFVMFMLIDQGVLEET